MQKGKRQVIIRRKAGGRADRMEAAEITKGRVAGRECSKQPKTQREEVKEAGRKTGRQADREKIRQADKHADRQTCTQADKQTSRQEGKKGFREAGNHTRASE